MKLKELLIEELPGRGGWPDGKTHAWQNHNTEIRFAPNADANFYPSNKTLCEKYRVIGVYDITPNHEISVTREQYEAALAAHNDGWIPWSGGECPVDGSVMVELRLRDNTDATDIAENWFWNHCGNEADIISYRLHNSASKKIEWDGKGLPPVGCECEVAQSGQIVWDKFKVIAVAGDAVFGLLNNVSAVALCVDIWSFRPAQSEAYKKRKETINLMDKRFKEVLAAGSTEAMAIFATVYDTIAAGKIPSGHVE